MSSEGYTESPPRTTKRQKIDVACDTCRLRKVKCDGLRPICSVCLKRKDKGVNCKWSVERQKLPLHDSGNATSNSQQPDAVQESHNPYQLANQSIFEHVGMVNSQQHSGANEVFPQSRERHVLDNVWPPPAQNEDPPENTFNEVNSMTGAIGGSKSGFFGSSSASSFMKEIKAAVDLKFMTPNKVFQSNKDNGSNVFAPSPLSAIQSDHVEYVLPPRRIADGFLGIYWDLVHPLYPFLDRGRFEEAYSCIWSGENMQGDEKMFMCTLNVIFAIACQLSETITAEDRAASAAMYFKRGQGLLHMSLWEAGTIELVQCLLMMGQYLQSTNMPHQCWMVIGHAIRVAQGIGLHLLAYNMSLPTQRKQELTRRIWHGCVLMDRVLSMTLGRPTIVSKATSGAVPLPTVIDCHLLSDEPGIFATQPADTPSTMAFFVKSLQLHDIISEVLLALYSGEASDSDKDRSTMVLNESQFSKVFQLDRALMNWGQTLPLHLRISASESFSNSIFFRQAIISRIRYLHTRILLFRPILSQFCLPQAALDDSGTVLDESLTQRMILQCSTLCLTAAHDLINIVRVHLIKNDVTGVLPAWWYNIFYVYTAATCLLAARLRPVIQSDVANYSVQSSWDHAIEILKSLECFGESSQRCVTALELLSARVSHITDLVNKDLSPNVHFSPGHQDEATFASYERRGPLDTPNFDLNDMSWINSVPGNF